MVSADTFSSEKLRPERSFLATDCMVWTYISGITIKYIFKFNVKEILEWEQLNGLVDSVNDGGDMIKIEIGSWELILFPLGIRIKQGKFIYIVSFVCDCENRLKGKSNIKFTHPRIS